MSHYIELQYCIKLLPKTFLKIAEFHIDVHMNGSLNLCDLTELDCAVAVFSMH